MSHRQVSVRLLLVGLAIAGVAVCWLTDQARRRGRAIATTKRVAGVVQLDDEHDPLLPVPEPSHIDVTGWLDRTAGPQLAHRLSVVNLDGTRVSDDDLKNLEGIASLRRLYLNGTPITAAGTSHLRRLRTSRSSSCARPAWATRVWRSSTNARLCVRSIFLRRVCVTLASLTWRG